MQYPHTTQGACLTKRDAKFLVCADILAIGTGTRSMFDSECGEFHLDAGKLPTIE
jgi:hypothetical protein